MRRSYIYDEKEMKKGRSDEKVMRRREGDEKETRRREVVRGR